MAKKELTRADHVIKCYSKLHDINQRLKNISSCYYISYDNNIYMKSLVSFTETLVELRYPETIDVFQGSMILPNKFFSYAKNAKKTKITVEEKYDKEKNENKIILGQADNEDLKLDIDIVNSNADNYVPFIGDRIVPQMYKRYFYLQSDDYVQYEDQQLIQFSSEDFKDLLKPKPLIIPYNGTILTLTKELILDAKKDDSIELRRLCYQHMEGNNCRVFYMLDHVCDLYISHTIFNSLQSIEREI